MTIGDSFKRAVNIAFEYTIFFKRDEEFIANTLNMKFKHSDSMTILPHIPCIKVETIDETHDKVTLAFDDYQIDGVITWKPIKTNFVFVKFE